MPDIPTLPRRGFLILGGASAAGLFVAGCGDDDDDGGGGASTQTETQPDQQADVTLDFATTAGVLNYAYALEQLEAAFYAQVTDKLPAGIKGQEARVFQDIAAHEAVHAAFLKAVLADNAIPALEPNFEAVDFADRDSVVQTAMTFENLGVGAYNGAAKFLAANVGSDKLAATALMAAGDIVSVEARHASIIGALAESGRGGKKFAPKAFDDALAPADVLEAAKPFIKQTVAVMNADAPGG